MSGTRRRFFSGCGGVWSGVVSGYTERCAAARRRIHSNQPRENENGRHHSPYGSHGPHPAQARAVLRDQALPMVTPDVADLAHENGWEREGLPRRRRAGEEKIARLRPLMRGGTTEAAPGRRFRCSRATACVWCSRTGCRSRLPCTGMVWKYPLSRTACLTSARSRSRQARNMSTNSQCTRKARSSTTRTAPCRR